MRHSCEGKDTLITLEINFYSLDTVTLEVTVWILRLIRFLTQHCPKPPGIVNNGAESVSCTNTDILLREGFNSGPATGNQKNFR